MPSLIARVRKLLFQSSFLRTDRRRLGERHLVHDRKQAIQAIVFQERDPILYERLRAAETEMAGSDISFFSQLLLLFGRKRQAGDDLLTGAPLRVLDGKERTDWARRGGGAG